MNLISAWVVAKQVASFFNQISASELRIRVAYKKMCKETLRNRSTKFIQLHAELQKWLAYKKKKKTFTKGLYCCPQTAILHKIEACDDESYISPF